MTLLGTIKRLTGWTDAVEISSAFDEILFRGNALNASAAFIEATMAGACIVIAEDGYYVGSADFESGSLWCTAQFDTLEEACKSL